MCKKLIYLCLMCVAFISFTNCNAKDKTTEIMKGACKGYNENAFRLLEGRLSLSADIT